MPRWRRAAPTIPIASSRPATWSTIVCVSETVSETRTLGFARWNSQSSSGTTEPPGPVEAPIWSVPASSPSLASATSSTSCSSSASIR